MKKLILIFTLFLLTSVFCVSAQEAALIVDENGVVNGDPSEIITIPALAPAAPVCGDLKVE